MAQDSPKMGQDAPKMPQDGPKMAQRSPKMTPRWPQDGPKMVPKLGSKISPLLAPSLLGQSSGARWPQDGQRVLNSILPSRYLDKLCTLTRTGTAKDTQALRQATSLQTESTLSSTGATRQTQALRKAATSTNFALSLQHALLRTLKL